MLDKFAKGRQVSRAFGEFAHFADLVEFGDVTDESDQVLIKGFTFTKTHKDEHFMHGNIDGIEVTCLLRTAEFKHPEHQNETKTWSLMRFGVDVQSLPHILILANTYNEIIIKNILAKYPHLRLADAIIAEKNATFSSEFSTFCSTQDSLHILDLLHDSIMQQIATRYSAIDVEIDANAIILAAPEAPQNIDILKTLLEEGRWLVQMFEYIKTYGSTGETA